MDRRFDGGGGGGDCGGGGPTGSNSGGANEVVGHMYYDNVSSSRLGTENFSTNSQPFHIFATPYSTTTFKSPGYIPNSLSLSLQLYWGYETGINVGKRNVAAFLTGSQSVCENYAERIMAASVAFPFTSAQWRELEQQAMIYKYMISSVPVPPDLLLPLSRNFVDSSVPSMYNVRYLKNEDPEPGRCKRTDGKKWRCSKNVAPNQKYCERHLHRGRPRSRKPVEVKCNGENKKTRFEQRNIISHSTELLDPKSDLHFANAPSKANRDLSLMMEANTGFVNEGSSIYSPTSLFYQDYVEENPLNMLSYSSFAATEIDAPNVLVDAWSIGNGPSLDLSIAMASESYLDQEMANTKSYDEQSIKDFLGPVSWETFGQGGPLAEALPAFGCENRASPHDSIGPAATSPTGVLHRTLFSHSDGSVCNFSLCNFS